ncbi:sulfotransferase domain-containing protein [Planktotalea sp.]|uniref:sulfotransferase domain-containing protein n=1 Tax=Planktotalea sp. TaxID=2029877 RepID=UPI003D6C4C4D
MTQAAVTRANARQPIIVASHPRSGTHLVMDLLRRQFSSLHNWRFFGLPLDHLYLNLERLGADHRRFSQAQARKIVNRPKRALLKTHFTADFATSWAQDERTPPSGAWRDLAEQAHTLYVVRHPMDVMVSYHQFLSAIHTDVAQMDLMTFLHSRHWDNSADRLGWWQSHVQGWSAKPDACVIRYEDVVKATQNTLSQFAHEMGEQSKDRRPLLPPKVTSLRKTRLNRLTRLSPDSTAIIADRAGFPAINWQSALSPSDRREIAERLNPELDRFAYSLDDKARAK